METPKKPVKKDSSAKSASVKRPDEKPADVPAKKKIIDDDDDEDFDMPLDDLGRYENFDTYDDDDDY